MIIPEHDQESEVSLVQAAYLQPELTVTLDVKPGMIEDGYQRKLWETLGQIYAEGLTPDLRMLMDRSGVPPSVVAAASDGVSAANVDYYAKRVKDCAVRRAAKAVIGHSFHDITNGTGTQDVIGHLSLGLVKLTASSGARYSETRAVLDTVIDMAEREWRQDTGKLLTGIYRLDSTTGGMYPGELIVLGARPSVGKSALALQLATTQAANGVPTGYVSLEMTAAALGRRMLAGRARVEAGKLRGGQEGQQLTTADFSKLMEAAGPLAKLPLYFADSGVETLPEVLMMARIWIARHQIKLLVIDYLTLIAPTDPHIEYRLHVGEVTRGLKKLARDTGIVVLVLAQLRRPTSDAPPRLYDLRESGNIEQDADQVWLLHRKYTDTGTLQVETDLLIAKHREGSTGSVPLLFVPGWVMFEAVAG